MLKDVTIAAQLAKDYDVPLPFVEHCQSSYEAAHALAGPGKSLSELVRWVERSMGVDLTPAGAW